MIKVILIFLALALCRICGAQAQFSAEASVSLDLSKIEQLQIEGNDKIDAAFTAMQAVRDAGHYVNSISELLGSGRLSLPVGIKKGDYEFIIQRIMHNDETDRLQIYATCAFRFKDTGQRIAFEGVADIQGENGIDTHGELSLIVLVRRNIGSSSAIVIHEGSRVRFGCDGIEDFAVTLSWLVTSPHIIPVDNAGNPVNNTSVSATVNAYFEDFDNYLVSLNVDRSFMFSGLNDIIFSIRGVTLDQSDIETSTMTAFPEGYLSSGDEFNLWRGVSITEASVALPSIFKSPVDGGRITLSLRNALFDHNGFSGEVAATDVISSVLLDPDRWDISVSEFRLGFLKNEPVEAGFGGEINLPPFGGNSLFPYLAVYNRATGEFDFKVGIGGRTYDFPALSSTLALHESSNVEITVRGGELYPVISASGMLSVNAPMNETTGSTVFSVPDIPFENMRISRDAPYFSIGRIGISGDLRSPRVAGFELQITDIQSFDNATGSGLSFVTGVSLSDIFSGNTKILLYGDYDHWRFNRVDVESIAINYQSKVFSLAGGVWFKNGDELYGDGFRGDITMELLEKFKLDAVAVFGNKDNYRYFLTDVFLEIPPPGIPAPPLGFYGFGGGLYRRMQQTSSLTSGSDFGRSLSGINYIPDRTVNMGVMASTKFGLSGSPSAFNSRVTLEMQFNNNGGLNFVQFRGDAAMMDIPDKWGALSDNISKAIAEVEANGNVSRPATRSDLDGKIPDNKSSGFLTASINIKYDLINSVFTADMNAYLNAGLIRGVGANDRMGWASAYFSPNKWYTYVGTPTDRVGLEILRLARLDGYFMIGNDIPGLPLPPSKVLNNLSADKRAQLQRSSSSGITFDRGIAFGASLGVDFNATLMPFYASFGTALGGEFLLVDTRGHTCSGSGSIPGINGWYASAQAWAWVEAAIGIQARIFGRTQRFNILDISAAALLLGTGPNPMYFTGAVGGQFNVMGGLIKGKCSFDFEIGEKCVLSGDVSPFGEDIIAQLTPTTGETDVNVFTAPQAVFNIPVGVSMQINEDNGTRGTYRIQLEEFTVSYAGGAAITGHTTLSDDGMVYMLDPDEPFRSQQSVTVYAKVTFQKRVGNNWEYVRGGDGQPVFEDKTITFTSGERPDHILPHHVKYSYPIARQYNYYPNEHRQGYLQLIKDYTFLFTEDAPENCRQVLRFSSNGGAAQETEFTYRVDNSGGDIRMEINFSKENMSFANNRIYNMAIVNVPLNENADIASNVEAVTAQMEGVDDVTVTTQQAEGNLEMMEETEIYALHFRTSNFNTFVDKMGSLNTRNEGWRRNIEPFVYNINANLRVEELFDKYEIQWNESQIPLVRFEALTGQTQWFNNSFYPEMYSLTAYQQGMVSNRNRFDNRSFGTPPVAAVFISGNERLVTDAEISTGTPTGYGFLSSINYTLSYWCARDFYYIRVELAKKGNNALTNAEAAILIANAPPIVSFGSYPVRARYVLPGKEIVTSTAEFEMFYPVID